MTQQAAAGRVRARWRDSLYTRALLVMAAGSVVLLAGAFYHSQLVLRLFQSRLGAERTALAHAVGGALENRLGDDLEHLSSWANRAMQDGAGPAAAGRPPGILFDTGVVLLDASGAVARAPATLDVPTAELGEVLARARSRRQAVAAGFGRQSRGPALALVAPAFQEEGRLLGYAVALPSAATVEQLLPRYPSTGAVLSPGSIQLVDARGRVLASTGDEPGPITDHDSVLARAVRDHRPLFGHCHRCHEEPGHARVRTREVLAFAPMQSLELGVAVRQLETEALGDVTTLQRILMGGALVLVGLFLAAGGLSVASAVRPVGRLMRAVRALEKPGSAAPLPSFGRSEVGELAAALEDWRGRLDGALAAAERSRAALGEEVESSTRLLQALFSVTAASLDAAHVETIAVHGLDRLLDVLGFDSGALRIVWHERSFDAARSADGDVPSDAWVRAASLLADGTRTVEGCRSLTAEPGSLGISGKCGPVFLADLEMKGGPRVTAILCGAGRTPVEDRRLQALLHHIRVSAANVLLKEEEQQRERLRREYLRSVLAAQEDERLRIARELHDTVAQDLAALRLHLERLSAPGRAVPDELRALEARAHEMLDTVRRITLDLRPAVLDAMGFLPALQWQFERVQRENRLRGRFTVEGEPIEPDKDRSVRLFRIFQECLQNVAQHARAEHVFVTVTFSPEGIAVATEDDGVGFDPSRLDRGPDAHGRGLGLLGMQERAKILGGTMVLETGPGEGTTVRVEVPLRPVVPVDGGAS